MRILIDILHPAHVHFFRNFHNEMTRRGHEVCIVARDKDRSIELLEAYDLPFEQLSVQQPGGLRMATEMIQRTAKLLKLARAFKPDVMTGIMGPSIAVAGRLTRTPAVVFYDTEFAVQTNRWVYPLASSVCTPDCYQGAVRGNHVTYAGYHELAYLHPERFQPDPGRLVAFGIEPGTPYTVVRFVSWQAVHDRHERGLTGEQKRELLARLAEHGRVLVSSETALPADLASLALAGPVQDIHHVLAHAQLVVGESATMSSEAAVLGVPAVFVATTGRGYTDDQERRYGLVRHLTEEQLDEAIAAIDGFLAPSAAGFGQEARHRLLADKIDVTSWQIEYFESKFGAGKRAAGKG